MTSTLRKLSLLALVALPLLHGCGSGSSSNSSSSVRLVNATGSYPSLDLYSSTNAVSTGVASYKAGSYGNVDSGTQSLTLRPAGTATAAATGSYSLGGGTRYTVVSYIAPAGSLAGALLTDSEAAPTAGTAKFRIYNTISYVPSGSSTANDLLDVYVTETTASCAALAGSGVSPTASNVRALGAYTEIAASAAGTSYRVCVTGAGDRGDLRLDLPALTLKNQQITTLVLTTTPGGVLVNGVQVDQQGDVTARANPSARVRIVANAANGVPVSATVNGTELARNLASPVIGSYVPVPAGALTASVQIGGVTVPAAGLSAEPGADLTLLVAGSSAQPTVALIADSNRPSTSAAAQARLRLVNGVNGLPVGGSLTLLDNFTPVASGVEFGKASPAASVAATTGTLLEVTSTSSVLVGGTPTQSVYRLSGDNAPTLAAGKVYTVFVLGDVNAPVGALRQDR